MALGCYVPQYLTASFKGFEFQALAVGSKHGRRGAVGEFPFGEETGYVDLGRKMRTYTLRARFPENSHIADSRSFITVCESTGPGTLVHPVAGIVSAACVSASVTDNPIEEQGVTYVDLDFVEANEWLTTNGLLDALLYGIDSSGLLTAATTAFLTNYAPTSVRIFRQADVAATASTVITAIRDAFASTLGDTSARTDWQILAEFDMVLEDQSRLFDAATIKNVILNGTEAIAGKISELEQFTLFRKINNSITGTSSNAPDVVATENALFTLTRVASTINMVRGAMGVTVGTLSEALERVRVIDAFLDQEITTARGICEDYVMVELQRYSAKAQALLLDNAYNLPTLVQYNYFGASHALAAAWEIYGNATRSRELEARNPHLSPWNFGPTIIAARG